MSDEAKAMLHLDWLEQQRKVCQCPDVHTRQPIQEQTFIGANWRQYCRKCLKQVAV